MKYRRTFLVAVVVLVVFATGPANFVAGGRSSQGAPPISTMAEVLDLQVTQMEKQIMRMAEAMPADKFDFNPTNLNLPDSRDPVRTFSGQLKHLATDNYDIWSPMTGDAPPAGIVGVEGPPELKSREDILKYVKGSFAEGHKAAATLNSKNDLELLEFRGQKLPRQYLATFALIHCSDHAGQLAVYLRLAGVTPPGSQKR